MVYVVKPDNLWEDAPSFIPRYSNKYKFYESPRTKISKRKSDKSNTKSFKITKTNSYSNNAVGGKRKKRKSKTRRHQK